MVDASVLIPLSICFASMLLQSWPSYFNKSFGVDVWTRLLEIRHMRDHGHAIPREKLSKQFIIDGYFDYPPVFPFLLSFFSEKKLLQIKGLISPFFDAIQGFMVFQVAYLLTQNLWFATVAQITYSLTPVIAAENSQLTPRSLGYTNFTFAAMSLVLYYLQPMQAMWLYIGVGATTLLFLTHRFAMQAFLFLTLFFTFYLNTALFIQSFIVGFALAVILTQGYYLRVLKGHLSNIYFWVVNLDYRYAHQVRGIIKKDTQTDLINRIYKIVEVFSPVAIFGMNPWAFSGILYGALRYMDMLPAHELYDILAAWIIFFYVLGVIILKVRVLMPIGEGYRYMEMATAPSALLSTMLIFHFAHGQIGQIYGASYGALLLVCFGVILFFQIKSVVKDKNRTVTTAMEQAFDYINKHSSDKKQLRILCIPHQNTTMTVLHTTAAVFVNADNPGLLRVTEVYPILRVPVAQLAKKYNLTHVLIKTGFVTLKELGLSKKDIVFASGDVELVKVWVGF